MATLWMGPKEIRNPGDFTARTRKQINMITLVKKKIYRFRHLLQGLSEPDPIHTLLADTSENLDQVTCTYLTRWHTQHSYLPGFSRGIKAVAELDWRTARQCMPERNWLAWDQLDMWSLEESKATEELALLASEVLRG